MTRLDTFSILDQFNGFDSLGIASIGQRVTFSAPDLLPLEIEARAVLAQGKTIGQVEPVFIEIVKRYLADLRQNVIDEWENTYYNNIGVKNAYVDAGKPEWFPALAAKQTHTWYTTVRPQVIGVEFLATGLLDALDFDSFTINGLKDPNGLRIEQNEEKQHMPVFGTFSLKPMQYIGQGGP